MCAAARLQPAKELERAESREQRNKNGRKSRAARAMLRNIAEARYSGELDEVKMYRRLADVAKRSGASVLEVKAWESAVSVRVTRSADAKSVRSRTATQRYEG